MNSTARFRRSCSSRAALAIEYAQSTRMTDPLDRKLVARLWRTLGTSERALDQLSIEGPCGLLPSVFAVDTLATSAVALSLLSIAELAAARRGGAVPAVQIDRRQAAVLFRSERYVQPLDWEQPPLLDALMGDYRTRSGFIRLHTNYPYHRAALLNVLGVVDARAAVTAAVSAYDSEELEDAVVAAGGCAAAMRTPTDWQTHEQGRALSHEALFELQTRPATLDLPALTPAELPLCGVRVLDLTRVIAGPIATRLLAAYGAEVLRIDPPGFQEVPALLSETTVGKRRAFLDLKSAQGRTRLDLLLRRAHVLVYGGRHGALDRLGFTREHLLDLNPSLIFVRENAYGFTGPWAHRRGFDSLVQMSIGLAQRGMEALDANKPVSLPAQALDHATGYLLAAAVCTALTRGLREQRACETRTSLARCGALLMALGEPGDPRCPDMTAHDIAPYLQEADTGFGRVRRVGPARGIAGISPTWTLAAGPLGVDAPAWSTA